MNSQKLIFNNKLIQDISRAEDALATLKAMQGQTPTSQMELDISRLEKEIETYSQEKLCYEAQILRVYISFYLSIHTHSLADRVFSVAPVKSIRKCPHDTIAKFYLKKS